MKIETTLILLINLLFINNINAKSLEADACQTALEKGDVTTALAQANKALSANKNDSNALICLGRALAANDDLTGALATFKLANTQATDAFDKTVASMLMGNTQKQLKKYDEAIASYQAATAQAKASKVIAYERASYNAIGNIYFLKKEYQLALGQFELGSQLAANDNERGESFEKIALMHHKMQQHDLAVEFQLKGYAMQSKAGSLDERANAGIALGRYYGLAKSFSSAENTLNKLIQFAVDNGGAYYEAKANVVLASVKQAQDEKESANALIEKAKMIANNLQDKDLMTEIQQETQGWQ